MEQIRIGILVNTHGLQGEVKVKCMSDFPEQRFKKGNSVHIQYEGKLIDVMIQHVKVQKGMLLITFEGYEDINQVEQWKGCNISIDKTNLHELNEGEVYFFELIGCQVEDEQGVVYGEVSEVIETGANAILRVKRSEKDLLIPYVKAFIVDVNKEAKKIIVHLMEGLL